MTVNSNTRSALETARSAISAARGYLEAARSATARTVASGTTLDSSLLEREQRRVHGLAWVATTVAGLEQLVSWASSIEKRCPLNAADLLVVQIGCGEYLAQLLGGVPMSQNEFVRPCDLDACDAAETLHSDPAARYCLDQGNSVANRAALSSALATGWRPYEVMAEEELNLMREQMRRFTEEQIVPHAQRWHLEDALVPDEIVSQMAALGVFGVCISTDHGGLGLGKLAMCVVSEELSRGWIATGSLGTRSEIAGELIAANGTPEQKARWLPRLASGEIIPTAVFTEPNAGSDLASLSTRAFADGSGGWRITGAKTWITHAARSDLMTLLARTDPGSRGHRGLSMFLAPKTRGRAECPFPDEGLSGSDIPVLGYRGMREYALSFDNFRVGSDALLGQITGAGFRQLMQTFEGARIQTAARAVGVARRALDLGLAYALERRQFGKPLSAFARISDKLALMTVETVIARELTYFAARSKDAGMRCDIEAGMAKLLAARVAWSNADAALQIHGGNGYALEYEASRILCDARILSIFEGAAEIQATVVARGLLGQS